MRANTRTRSLPARMITTAAALGMILLVAALAPAYAWDNRTVTVSNTNLQVGDDIEVSGNGFTAGEVVDVEICGIPDSLGVLSCTPLLTGVAAAGNGTVKETVTVESPTGPCPCSIVIAGVNAPPTATRIDLLRHETATQARAPELVVDHAELVGGNLLSFFGAPAKKDLELTLRNAGVAPANPTLQLSWAKGDGERVAVTDPGVASVGPGQTQTVSIPVDLAGFSQGEWTVDGHVVVGDLYSSISATTSITPWGLYALLLLALAGAALLGARVLGRRGETAPQAVARPAAPRTSREPRPADNEVDIEQVAEFAIARATGAPVPAAEPQVAAADVDYVGPPRLAATPIVRREGLESFGEAPLPVAPPAPLPTPAQPVPPPATLDAAAYMQAYLETHAPKSAPLTDSLRAASESAAAPAPQPAVPAPASGSWDALGPIAEVPPPPLEIPPSAFPEAPVTPGRGLSIAERIAQATEPVGLSGEERASGPRTAGSPVARGAVVDTGADIVARALETIKEHSGSIRLADKDEYVVPAQRDRRAPKGGRRAAR